MRPHLAAVFVFCSCSDSAPDDSHDVAVTETSVEVDGDVVEADDGETTTPVVYPVPAIEWTPCDELYGEERARVDCAEVSVPLDWDHPDDGTITVFVKRARSAVWEADPDGPHRALWILTGGPGQAGSGAEALALVLAERDPELDIYLPDHRGTGHSTRMSCQGEAFFSQQGTFVNEKEWPGCRDEVTAEWGESMRFFSTTMAAHDTAGLVAAVHPAGDLVTVMGISYGTYLANRYMQVAEQHDSGLADGVVIDSICAPGHCVLSAQDQWEDEVARQILGRCADDADCAARFPGASGAWDALGELYQDIAAGHCAWTDMPDADAQYLRTALGIMMFSVVSRRATPAFIHRYQRCNDDDREVIARVYERTFGIVPGAAPPGPLDGYSWTLAVNVLVSELWEASNPSGEEILERWADTRSCRGVGVQLAWQEPGWPRYEEPLADTFAAVDIPVLALNAELDPATPAVYARTFEAHLTAPHQRYIEIPGAAHTVVAQGPLMSDPTTTCGRELLLQFVKDPATELDTSCLDDVMPLGFSLSDETLQSMFGTSDMWGD